MSGVPISRSEGTARNVARDVLDIQEARLWDHARLNLLLLYGGRRGGGCNAHGSGNDAATSPFGNREADV